MTGIKGINDMEVELTVTTGTQGHNGLLNFTVSAWVPTVEAHQTRTIAEVKGSWPDKFHPTFDSCIFKALYDLDYAISKATRKEGIPKA
jgi:hypothetical protein